MTQYVQMPDGSTHEFPDDATPEQIRAALLKLEGGQNRLTAAQRTVEGVKNLVTGDDRREFDYPDLLTMLPTGTDAAGGLPSLDKIGSLFGLNEAPVIEKPGQFPMTSAQADKLKNALALAQDDEQIADVLAQVLPGATLSADSFGNPVVTYQGQSAYLNRPGLSGQDLASASGFGAMAAATLAPVAAPLARMGLAARMGTVGAGTAGASAGQDLALNRMGAEKLIDPARVATMGLMGAGFEVLGPAAKWAYSQIVRRPQLYNPVTNQLTELGVQRLKEAGLTPDQISDDFAKEFAALAHTALVPDASARLAAAQSLPVPVPLTKGQTTLNPADQMLEDSMLKQPAVYGAGAQSRMIDVIGPEGTQQRALRANIPAIQQRIGGGAVVESGQGAATLQREMLARRDSAKAAVDTAYDAARDTSAGIGFPSVREGAFNIERSVAGDFDLAGLPRVQSLINDLKAFAPADGADGAAMIRSLFDWRKRASNASFGASSPEEQAAIMRAITGFDAWIDDAVKNGLMAGDQEAATLWKEAIRLRREFGKDFEGGDLIEDLTFRQMRGGRMQLAVSPEDAANYIFGASNAGWVARPNLTRDLARIKAELGADSISWNALREEAFLRFARAGEGQLQADIRQFSGANFKNAWDKALLQNPEILRVLFTDAERRLITQFANVAANVTQPVRGGQNFSNTGAALAQYGQSLLGMFGPKVATLLKGFIPLVRPAANAAREVQAMGRANYRPTPPAPLPGIGAAGAYGWDNRP